MNLCLHNSHYSLNCHVGATLVFYMLCRITQSSDVHRISQCKYQQKLYKKVQRPKFSNPGVGSPQKRTPHPWATEMKISTVQ